MCLPGQQALSPQVMHLSHTHSFGSLHLTNCSKEYFVIGLGNRSLVKWFTPLHTQLVLQHGVQGNRANRAQRPPSQDR